MPHAAIIGSTTAGKTFLAQNIAASFRRQNIRTLVLHKPREPWPKNAVWRQTPDPEEFLKWFWSEKRCACFMELADGFVDKFDDRFHACFTQGRHEGHRCFYLTQRAASVHPAIRENCVSIYLFTVSAKAASLWAEEFCDEKLHEAVTLKQYQFLFKASRYSPAVVSMLKKN